jgi:hypothetical protein
MNLPLGAYGELFPAARTPAGQNRPPVFGLHPGTEPVRLGAVTIIRLKCAFRHSFSII